MKPFVCTFCVCRRGEREQPDKTTLVYTYTSTHSSFRWGEEEEEERGPKESQGEELRSQPVGCTPEFF